MKHMQLTLSMQRSNPIILRTFTLPHTAVVDDLLAVVEILLDTRADKESFRLDGTLIAADVGLEEALESIPKSYLLNLNLIKDDGTSKKYDFFLDFDGFSEVNEEPMLPRILDACGINLPKDLPTLRDLNLLHQSILLSSAASSDVSYREKQLLFHREHTENALRERFAPDTIKEELNYRLAVPLKDILSCLKIAELKEIISNQGWYSYNSRKADLIDCILHHMTSAHYLEELFQQMPLPVFAAFRTIATARKPTVYRENRHGAVAFDILPNSIGSLIYRHLLFLTEENTIGIAEELLAYYRNWYNTPEEIDFIRRKCCSDSMRVCMNFYCLFTRQEFYSVLGELYPGRVDMTYAESYFNSVISDINTLKMTNPKKIEFANDNYLFDDGVLSRKTAQKIVQVISQNAAPAYLPKRNELACYIHCDYHTFLPKALTDMIEDTLKHYYYSYRSKDYCIALCTRLRANYSDSAIKNFLFNQNYAFRSYQESDWSKFFKLIDQTRRTIPLIALKGYHRSNCPAELLEVLKQLNF